MNALKDYLKPLEDDFIEEIRELKRINAIMELTCAYSPDHEAGGLYDKALTRISNLFSETRELAKLLDDLFFDVLYHDRPERENILNIIGGGNYLIVLSGLVGVGKTVVLQKIKHDVELEGLVNFIYLNFRKEVSRLEKLTEDQFVNEVSALLFEKILSIIPDNLHGEWNNYRIIADNNLRSIKGKIEVATGKILNTIDDVAQVRENANISEIISTGVEGIEPSLNPLLRFCVDKEIPLIICADNIDRRTYNEQLNVVDLCDSIVEEYGIPVLVAIRSTNIRNIILDLRNKRDDNSELSGVFFTEDFDEINPGERKHIKFLSIHPMYIRKMIWSRIEFLKTNELFGALKQYRDLYLEKHDLSLSPKEFDRMFWEVFEDITSEFVDRGMYEYTNYNLRELFIQFVSFTSTIILNPEKDYRWDKFKSGKYIDRTKLRTFLIKWQIANGSIVPGGDGGILNILTFPHNKMTMVELRLLTYIYNSSENKLTFANIKSDFSLLKVSDYDLRIALNKLKEVRGTQELGLIWIDCNDKDEISDESCIEMNPAGVYFLNSLSNSREYSMWVSLISDLNIKMVDSHFYLSDTYDDKFKLDVVYKLIDEVLIPALEMDVENIISTIDLPHEYIGSKTKYFKEKYTRDNTYFVIHLFRNVTGTIKNSDLDHEDQKIYERNYKGLFRKLKQFV